MAGGIPVTGDFNGDGVDEIGVFIDGQWFLDLNGNGVWDDGDLWAKLGDDGDLPVTGDWDGDGKTDIGIFGPAWVGDPRAVVAEAGLPDSQNQPTGRYKNLPPDPEEAPAEKRTLKRTAEGKVRADLIDHVFQYGTPGDRADRRRLERRRHRDDRRVPRRRVVPRRRRRRPLERRRPVRRVRPSAATCPSSATSTATASTSSASTATASGCSTPTATASSTPTTRSYELGGPGDLPVVGDFNGDGADEIGILRTGPDPDRQASR